VDYDIPFDIPSGSHGPSLDAYGLGGSDDIDVMAETHVRSRGRSDDLSDDGGGTQHDNGNGNDDSEKPAPRKRRKKNAEQKCSAVGCREEIKVTARNDGEHPLCEKHKRAAVARCRDGAEVCFCFYCNKAHGVEVRAGGVSHMIRSVSRDSHSTTKKCRQAGILHSGFFFTHPYLGWVVAPPGVSQLVTGPYCAPY
jgi:hypothetical protein